VSQLGFMFIGVGAGVFWAGILHLVTHAFFKGCLFLGAGSVMHGMGDETDIRKMGGLFRKMPHTATTFLIATIAATGILPLSGFFSKDAILAGAHGAHNPALAWAGPAAYYIGTLAALGTAFYMSRLYILTFFGKPRTHAAEHAHESSPLMTFPLWVLALLAIVALVLGLPGHGPLSEVFARFTEPAFGAATARLEGAHALTKHEGYGAFVIAWIIAVAGTLVAAAMYWRGLTALPGRLVAAFPRTYRLVADKFRIDELYELLVIEPVRVAADILWRVVDVFVIDGLVNLVGRFVAWTGSIFRLAQNGDVQRYAAVMAVAAAVILWAVLGVGG
jgi:NADH-quinone oxidoreductase subunit L